MFFFVVDRALLPLKTSENVKQVIDIQKKSNMKSKMNSSKQLRQLFSGYKKIILRRKKHFDTLGIS